MVDFRVDDDEIEKGECVTFSWLVRGDIDRIEFRKESKAPILVSAMDSREECPGEDTDYEFAARWLDGTQTARSIEVEVDDNSNGSSNGSEGATTPSEAGPFVNVTPILFQDTS